MESFPIPVVALREAVLNAIIHRDYAVPSPVQIRVYHDRLLIWNPGELPENWSSKKLLQQHPSKPFNPSVANAFFRAGEIEAWGRGIERIFEAWREAGTPKPRIQVEPGELWFEFPFSAAYLGSLTAEAAGGTTQETTQGQIIALLRENPALTRRALADRIGITPDGVKYHLGKLKESGLIRHVGPTKKGHWEVLENGHE